MRFRILGPLEVEADGMCIDLGRPKQRALLALLLIHANRVVSSDRLIEELWAGAPPDDAPGALQVQVSRLRRVLAGPGRPGQEVVESRPPGYVLRVGEGELDAARFESLLERGRAALAIDDDPEAATALLTEALGLWRGRALVEFADETFARAEADRLEELRLQAVEERIEAGLALGQHAALVPELRQLVGEHELRERLWGQLMVALYRCGRQAEALRAYGELRRYLGDELGIEPSAPLQRLEEAVLLQKSELDWEPREAPLAMGRLPLPVALPIDGEAAPFVGREAPLARLAEEWDRAMKAGPRLVLIGGEPGVGKTRLALELARVAHGLGASVLLGHCDEALAAPYQPFAEALTRVVRQVGREEVQAWPGELSHLVPDLAGAVAAPIASDPETEQYRLFEAVARVLEGLARRAPVVLLLDDLHWAAKPTLMMLRHVVTRTDPFPLVAVGTYRSTEPGLVEELGRPAEINRIGLEGLDEADVRTYVSAVSGQDGGEALARSLRDATAGNPFFISELLRSGLAGGGDGAAIPVTEGVRALVRQRLGRLSDSCNRLLTVASVVGLHYDLTVLQLATAVDEDELLAGLEEAIDAGLVFETTGTTLRQGFTHGIVREALYEGLTGARRAQLHRRVGEAMETASAGRPDDHLAELANHFAEAAALGGPAKAKAVEYCIRAGEQAVVQLAHDDAVAQFVRALQLLGDGALPGAPEHRCELLIKLGEAQRRAGQAGHRQTLLDAARLAQQVGDAPRLARAALANGRAFWSATNTVDGERVAALEAALAALSADDSQLRACLQANLAVELVYGGDLAAVRRHSDEALAMARRLGDLPTLAKVLAPRYNSLRGDPGTLPERLANTAELLAVAGQLPDPTLRCEAWGWRAIATVEAGDAHEAIHCFETFVRLAAEVRQPTMLWYATYLRASREMLAARFDAAEGLAAEALRLGRIAGQPDADLFASTQRMALAFERGGLAKWERFIRIALTRPTGSAWFLRSWQALAMCELDRWDEARAIFEGLAANDFTDLTFEPTWLHVVATSAAVCADLGDGTRAKVLFDLLVPYEDQVVNVSSLAYTGSVCHYLGRLAATMERTDEAEAYFARAAEVHERLQAPAWLARTQLAWGRLTGSPELVEQAREAAARLGLATVERRAVGLLAR